MNQEDATIYFFFIYDYFLRALTIYLYLMHALFQLLRVGQAIILLPSANQIWKIFFCNRIGYHSFHKSVFFRTTIEQRKTNDTVKCGFTWCWSFFYVMWIVKVICSGEKVRFGSIDADINKAAGILYIFSPLGNVNVRN